MISVLMCSCNGERFIEEQVISILEQNLKPDILYIVDDKSTDGTYNIAKRFEKNKGTKIMCFQNDIRKGPSRNFLESLELVSGQYIFFSDQDDIWLPEKINNAIVEMSKSPQEIPTLFHTDLHIVSSELEYQGSFFENRKIWNQEEDPLSVLLVQNFVTGCTVCMNASLKKHVERSQPFAKNCIMYDWWVALLAACFGRILYSSKADILYRQHTNNVVGAKKLLSMHNLYQFIRHGAENTKLQHLILQAEDLNKYVRSTGSNIRKIEKFASMNKMSKREALSLVLNGSIRKQGVMRNISLLRSIIG